MQEKAGAPTLYGALSKYRGAVMGFAALWIFIFHEYTVLSPAGTAIYTAAKFVKSIGFAGVDIFLFLSGYGLCFSMERGGVGRFYLRRALRILPTLLITAIGYALLEGWTPLDFLKNVTGWSFWFKNVNSFLWFMPAIMALYALFPVYYSLLRRQKSPEIFTLTVMAVWLLFSMLRRDAVRYDLFAFTNRIPVFITGAMCAMRSAKSPGYDGGRLALFAAMLALGLYLALLANYRGVKLLLTVSNCCIPTYMLAVSVSFLLPWVLGYAEKIAPGRWLVKLLEFFGKMSLEFYCVQEAVGRKIVEEIGGKAEPFLLNIVILVASVLAAWLLYLCAAALSRAAA